MSKIENDYANIDNIGSWNSFFESIANSQNNYLNGWQHRKSIVQVLNRICTSVSDHCALFPDGNTYMVKNAALSHESGCIEIMFECFTYIIKPMFLQYHCMDDNNLSYFSLHNFTLKPSETDDVEVNENGFEELHEFYPKCYCSTNVVVEPDEFPRLIRRQLECSSIMILNNKSPYLKADVVRNEVHYFMNPIEIENYIASIEKASFID